VNAKNKNEHQKEKNPTKSICEKKKTRKKGTKNAVFWIKKEQIDKPEKVTMFSTEIFKHV
jgi:hypothetical protein